ncbi:hypothetical protein MHBO_001593 [Bonamia ostreae]|uniref:Uncharacterized protein n=1 Tax=Bonamia ostreae TaxID=126728 RepID=A0ABV2AJJ6_9EUKA
MPKTLKKSQTENVKNKSLLTELGSLRKDIREGICILNAKKMGKPVSQHVLNFWRKELEDQNGEDEKLKKELEALRHKICDLEKENKNLIDEMNEQRRQLMKQIDQLNLQLRNENIQK